MQKKKKKQRKRQSNPTNKSTYKCITNISKQTPELWWIDFNNSWINFKFCYNLFFYFPEDKTPAASQETH